MKNYEKSVSRQLQSLFQYSSAETEEDYKKFVVA
jgi:hypothetical protein